MPKTLKGSDAVAAFRNSSKGQVVLVLQGGGALGAYQVGVYQALHEAGIKLDWIIGTSIGAINAGLIAGNTPERRVDALQEFWRRMRSERGLALSAGLDRTSGRDVVPNDLFGGISSFFRPNAAAFLGPHIRLGAESAGFYSTTPLRKTVSELVDFSLINRSSLRVTVGASHVRTGMMRYFDSRNQAITIDHILASGALPPAFPAVRINGEFYWDGGILSNSPTEVIFEDNPRLTSLIFSVHLWNQNGPEPETIWEVLHRQKDIQYSSRIAGQIARLKQTHRLRLVITELARLLPEGVRASEAAKELESYGCVTRMHVVRLMAPRLDNENLTKDLDFSRSGIRMRQEAGYSATMQALDQAAWQGEFDPLEGVILHDPTPEEAMVAE